MSLIRPFLFCIALLFINSAFANDEGKTSDNAAAESIEEPLVEAFVGAEDERVFSKKELAINFGAMYVAQWAVYLVTQEETIRDHGSWENFATYPYQPVFDKDTFDYNLFKHAWSGQMYYQYYRFRGYSEPQAFLWTFISSAAFEFAIEPLTEKPSIQDIYQTPIYGTLVGMGFERLSNYFIRSDWWAAKALAVVLNPFRILPKYEISAMPLLQKESSGLLVSWRY